MGDGLEQSRAEITSCYHQGSREGGGQEFQDETCPPKMLLLPTKLWYFVVLKQLQHVINIQEK